MGVLDQEKEIQSLKKKISELESKIKDKGGDFASFGRSYSKIGSSNSDFLIQTKGQVKIQWGSKFIDLIKDGKINIDSKFIYKESKVGVKDGIYIVGEGVESQVILKSGDTELSLSGEAGTTYVSFQKQQQTTSEQKYTALTNIGFLYKNIEDININSLQNGIVYIEAEQKLYIIQNGVLSEFNVSFPNPYKEQFVIQKSNNSKGSILIVGNGIENSLAFNSFYLYTSDEGVYLESDGNIYFKVAGQERIVIGQEETIFSNRVTSQMFKSKSATENSGFRLYLKNNQSTLEVDNLTIRNQANLFPKGSIIMFGGAFEDIPNGWAICDGQNGTPNLIGKFIKAGSTSGEEGGEVEIKLTSENMPQHTHTFVEGIFQTSEDGEHTHTVSYQSGDLGGNTNNGNTIIGQQTTTTSSNGTHSHTIDMSSAQLSQEGQGTPLKWEPRYYSLIYIMKII